MPLFAETQKHKRSTLAVAILCAFATLPLAQTQAAPIALANTPLFVTTPVLPNLLVVLDNSESMDGTMAGKLIAGDDASTRSNIARTVMRNTITNYRTAFNWGLMSFDISGVTLNATYAYYLGSDTGMVFTDNCSGTPLRTSSGQSCIANPTPFAGGTYVTYDASGDDPSINDVLYTPAQTDSSQCALTTIGSITYCKAMWAITNNTPSAYYFFGNHSATNSWDSSYFWGSPLGNSAVTLTPTDAGYLPHNPPITHQLYVPRAWGYTGNNSGHGVLNEQIQADSSAHYNNLMSYLATETSSNTSELKNGSTFTPLPGTMQSAKSYFSGSSTPINNSCQKNFAILVTDGQPTADTSGNQYTAAAQAAGTPMTDTINAITALRTTAVGASNYDIQTYIVGLGDTVQNPTAIANLNKMAVAGGTGPNAYLANNSAAFSSAIQSITASISGKVSSASAVALNSTQISTGSKLFQGRFNPTDWSGQLLAYPVNADGSLGSLLWDAGQQVNAQNWSTGRVILTNNLTSTNSTGKGIAFRWPASPSSPTTNEINANQVAALNKNTSGTTDGQGQLRLQYVRGDQSNEGASPKFRPRKTSVLGDIVDSNSTYVGKPPFTYPDSMEAAAYSSFAKNNASRTPIVYAGANDGMLHAINASNGSEVMAYVPSKMFNNLSKLTDNNYAHRFYVDGSPTSGDVFYGGAWHTVLVGSLRDGGQGIYALDITNPANFTEANASGVVLWEYNDADDADLGYTYTQPMIVRMANGKWAAVFGNGYNNSEADGNASTTGYAAIYIVDIQTGALIKKLTTQTGSTTTPNGFASVTPVDVNGDNIVDYIYGGDLLGNVWRFDVRGATTSSWGSSYMSGTTPLPLFTAKDASGHAQPITSKITVGRNPVSGYMVYFGTGQYLALSDLTTTATQTYYGIWDNGATVSGRSALLQQTISSTNTTAATGTFRTSTSNGSSPSMYQGATPKKGWYIDLIDSGERQITDSIINDGNIVFSTLIPNTAVCSAGGSGWIMELDAVTGNMISDPVFPTAANNFSSSDVATSGVKTSAIPTTPRIVSKQGVSYESSGGSSNQLFGQQKKLVSLSDGSIANQLEKSVITQKRIMWRQPQ